MNNNWDWHNQNHCQGLAGIENGLFQMKRGVKSPLCLGFLLALWGCLGKGNTSLGLRKWAGQRPQGPRQLHEWCLHVGVGASTTSSGQPLFQPTPTKDGWGSSGRSGEKLRKKTEAKKQNWMLIHILGLSHSQPGSSFEARFKWELEKLQFKARSHYKVQERKW